MLFFNSFFQERFQRKQLIDKQKKDIEQLKKDVESQQIWRFDDDQRATKRWVELNKENTALKNKVFNAESNQQIAYKVKFEAEQALKKAESGLELLNTKIQEKKDELMEAVDKNNKIHEEELNTERKKVKALERELAKYKPKPKKKPTKKAAPKKKAVKKVVKKKVVKTTSKKK